MYYFCTYFDSNYLTRGLALYESLAAHCSSFELWILCMDDEAYEALAKMRLPHARLIKLADFEKGDDALLNAKGNRSRIEYYFTCTPSLPLYVFEQCPQAQLITYVDADHFFFSDPGVMFEELGENSISIIEHRFPPHLKEWEDRGKFNVGILTFRRDRNGIACLKWWRERCLEWCYDRLEDERYADQKYLDEWPDLFAGVKVLQDKGVGLALWNASNYQIEFTDGRVTIDGEPLVCYHFHGFKQVGRRTYATSLEQFDLTSSKVMRTRIYRPYLRAILRASRLLGESPGSTAYAAKTIRYQELADAGAPPQPRGPWQRFAVWRHTSRARVRKILTGEHLLVIGRFAI